MIDEGKIRQLFNSMKVHSSILVIGAGASYEMGLPLYAQFPEIIWRIFDEFPELKDEMGYKRESFAKECIGKDVNLIKASFTYIEKHQGACRKFKKIFNEICKEHSSQISNVHRVICKLLHENKIKLVISLNWDDLLEQAWEDAYGTDINGEYTQLLKPHGDVRDIDGKWIFPNNPGFVSTEEMDIIHSIVNEKPIAFVILGYSENDRTIVEKIIEPLSNISETYRIGLDKTATINSTANDAMFCLEKLCEKNSENWRHLNYKQKNGMERALLGYRLTPAEVCACARFSCIEYAKQNLQQVNYTIIQSEPGCGKSITAFQIGHDYLLEGWEILLYRNVESQNIELPYSRYKTIYIVDDAQQLSDIEVLDIIGKVDQRHKVIITRTISNNHEDGTITITNRQAIKEIKKFYLKNEKQVTDILNSFDKQNDIGDLNLQTPLKWILDRAEKEGTPWLFNYSLRGGWKEIQQKYTYVRDMQNAECTLYIIAVKQILSLDKEIKLEDVAMLNEQYFGISYDKTFSDIVFLKNYKLVIGEESVRTIHLQLASRIIMLSYSSAETEEKEKYVNFIRAKFIDESTSLLGMVWLTNLTFAYVDSRKFHSEIYGDEVCKVLVKRCFSQMDCEKQRDAGYLLDLLIRKNSKYSYQLLLNSYNLELKRFIEDTNQYSVWSSRDICNSMYNESKKLKTMFIARVDLSRVLSQLKDVNEKTLYGWAVFLDRLSIGQSDIWKKKFFEKMPIGELCNVLRNISHEKIGALCEMMFVLYCFNKDFAQKEYYSVLPVLVRSLKVSLAETLGEMDMNFRMTFWGEGFLERERKNKEQKKALLTLCNNIPQKVVIDALESAKPREWEEICNFLYQMEAVDKGKVREIIKALDVDKLETITRGLWEEQPAELQVLLLTIESHDKKKVRMLISNHLSEMTKMKSTIVACAPKIAVDFVSKGGEVELYEKWYNWHSVPIEALEKISAINRNVFEKIVRDNEQIIMNRFLRCEQLYWSDNKALFCLLCKHVPVCVDKMLSVVEVNDIKERWKTSIYNSNSGNKEQRKKFNDLLITLQALSKTIHNEELQAFFEEICIQLEVFLKNGVDKNRK